MKARRPAGAHPQQRENGAAPPAREAGLIQAIQQDRKHSLDQLAKEAEGDPHAIAVPDPDGGNNEASLDIVEVEPSIKALGELEEISDDEISAQIEAELTARTADADDAYKMFLREVKQFPVLPREAEAQLAERMSRGDRVARDMLVNHNLRLVIAQSRRYRRRSISIMDLIQVGVEKGLLHAATKYDYTRGIKFSTYATYWIRQAVSREAAARTVQLPIHVHERIQRIKRARSKLAQELGREPNNEEIAREMPDEHPEWTADRVEEVLRVSQDPASLDSAINTEGESSRGDLIEDEGLESPEDVLMTQSLKERIADVLDTLTNRERRVLQLRFGLNEDGQPRTLEEVGREFSVTRERVRQIEARALRKLAKPGRARQIKDYLE